MPDLFATEPRPRVEPIAPETSALGALARAFAHDHALSYPHRKNADGAPLIPAESWIARYAETHGLHQARRFHQALHRLTPAERATIARDLTRESADA